MIDQTSLAKIAKLHPKIRQEITNLLEQVDIALSGRSAIRIVQGYRSYEEQAALYAKGRTTPGPKVTNAPAGSSWHNWGLAIDFCLILDSKEVSWDIKSDFDNDKQSDWMEVVNIFKKAGWTWGGSFKTITDMPHLEKTFGKTLDQMKELKKANKVDKEGYVLI